MSQSFNITARLQLQAGNFQPVIASLQQQLSGFKANVNAGFSPASARGMATVNAQIANLQGQVVATTQTLNRFTRVVSGTGISTPGLTQAARQFGQLANAATKAQQTVSGVSNEFERLGHQAAISGRRYLAFSLGAVSFVKIAGTIRQAANEAIEFQHNIVRLGQLGAVSSREVNVISDSITRLSTSLGVSSRQLADITIYLKGAGLSVSEVKDALEALSKTSLAPTFGDLRATTEGLLSLRAQFNLSSRDFEGVLGSINNVAKEFAAESEDIIEAVRRSGSAFRAASGDFQSPMQSLNEFVALFTSVRATTRESAESIATSFRTIFARLQSNEVVANLKQMGINLRFTKEEAAAAGQNIEGQFVGGYRAIQRISQALKGVQSTDPRFSAIVQQIGGVRQVSRVIPLLTQTETAQKAYAAALSGTTSLTRDADKAQEAFATRLNKLHEEFLALVREITQSRAMTNLIDAFTVGATAATHLVRTLSPLVPLLTTLAAIKIGINLGNFAKGFVSQTVNPRQRFATGGIVRGGSGATHSDSVHTMAPRNAFVIRATVANKLSNQAIRSLTSEDDSKNQDMVPVAVMPGEVIVPPNRARKYSGLLNELNKGFVNSRTNHFASGGSIIASALKVSKKKLMLSQMRSELSPADYIRWKNMNAIKAQSAERGIPVAELMRPGGGYEPGSPVRHGWDWLDEEKHFLGGLIGRRAGSIPRNLRSQLTRQFGNIDFERLANFSQVSSLGKPGDNVRGQFVPFGKTGPEVSVRKGIATPERTTAHEFFHAADFHAAKAYARETGEKVAKKSPYASTIPGHIHNEIAKAAIKPLYNQVANVKFYDKFAEKHGIEPEKVHQAEAFAIAMQEYGQRQKLLQSGYAEHQLPEHLRSQESRDIFDRIEKQVLPHVQKTTASLPQRPTPQGKPSLLGRLFARIKIGGGKDAVAKPQSTSPPKTPRPAPVVAEPEQVPAPVAVQPEPAPQVTPPITTQPTPETTVSSDPYYKVGRLKVPHNVQDPEDIDKLRHILLGSNPFVKREKKDAALRAIGQGHLAPPARPGDPEVSVKRAYRILTPTAEDQELIDRKRRARVAKSQGRQAPLVDREADNQLDILEQVVDRRSGLDYEDQLRQAKALELLDMRSKMKGGGKERVYKEAVDAGFEFSTTSQRPVDPAEEARKAQIKKNIKASEDVYNIKEVRDFLSNHHPESGAEGNERGYPRQVTELATSAREAVLGGGYSYETNKPENYHRDRYAAVQAITRQHGYELGMPEYQEAHQRLISGVSPIKPQVRRQVQVAQQRAKDVFARRNRGIGVAGVRAAQSQNINIAAHNQYREVQAKDAAELQAQLDATAQPVTPQTASKPRRQTSAASGAGTATPPNQPPRKRPPAPPTGGAPVPPNDPIANILKQILVAIKNGNKKSDKPKPQVQEKSPDVKKTDEKEYRVMDIRGTGNPQRKFITGPTGVAQEANNTPRPRPSQDVYPIDERRRFVAGRGGVRVENVTRQVPRETGAIPLDDDPLLGIHTRPMLDRYYRDVLPKRGPRPQRQNLFKFTDAETDINNLVTSRDFLSAIPVDAPALTQEELDREVYNNVSKRQRRARPEIDPVEYRLTRADRRAGLRISRFDELAGTGDTTDRLTSEGQQARSRRSEALRQIRMASNGDRQLAQRAVRGEADILTGQNGQVHRIEDVSAQRAASKAGTHQGFRDFFSLKRSPVKARLGNLFRPEAAQLMSPLSDDEEFQLQLARLQSSDPNKVDVARESLIQQRGGMRKVGGNRFGRFGAGLSKVGRTGLGVTALAAQFAPEIAQGITGTFEDPGLGGVQGVKRGKQIGGAVSGAATGAAIGSFAGPWGTAIGAVIGGLHGLATASQEADKELRAIQLEKTFKKLDSSIESVLSGRQTIGRGLGEVRTQLRELDRAESESNQRTDRAGMYRRLVTGALIPGGLGGALEGLNTAGLTKENYNAKLGESIFGKTGALGSQGVVQRALGGPDSLPGFALNSVLGEKGLVGGFFNEDPQATARQRYADRKKFLQENVEPRVGQYRAFNENLAQNIKIDPKLLATTDERGRRLSEQQLEDNRQRRIKEFDSRGGADIASKIVEATPGMTSDKYYREIDRVIVEANRERVAHQALTNAINKQELEIQKIGRISDAVQAAASSVENLRHGLDATEAAFSGSLQAIEAFSHVSAAENIGGLNNAAHARAVEFVTGSIRGNLKGPSAGLVNQFGEASTHVNTLRSILPDIVNSANTGSGIEGEGLRSRILAGIEAHGKPGIDPNNEVGDIPKVIRDRIANVLDGMKPEDLAKNASDNVQKFVDELIKNGFANVNEVLSNAAKELENKANEFNAGLIKNQEMINKIGEAQDRYATLQVQAAQSRARVQAEVAGRPGQTDLAIETQLAPLQQRQERLTGLSGRDANNPQLVSQRLQSVRQQIDTKLRERDESPNQQAANIAAEGLATLQGQAQRLGQALEHLAEPAERNAIIQEKLNRIEESRNSKLSFTEKLITAKPQERVQMQRNARFSDIAVQQGTLAGLRPEAVSGALEHLRSLGEAELPGYGGRKASDVSKQLLINTARQGGVLTPQDERRRFGLMGEQAGNDQTAVAAQGEIIKGQESLQVRFFTELKGIQTEFFNKLAVSLAEAAKKDVAAQVGETQGQLNKALAAKQSQQFFNSIGLTTEQARTAQSSGVGEVADLIQSSKGLKGRYAQAQEEIVNGPAASMLTRAFGSPNLDPKSRDDARTGLASQLSRILDVSHEEASIDILPEVEKQLSGQRATPELARQALSGVLSTYQRGHSQRLDQRIQSKAGEVSQTVFGGRDIVPKQRNAIVDLAAKPQTAVQTNLKASESFPNDEAIGLSLGNAQRQLSNLNRQQVDTDKDNIREVENQKRQQQNRAAALVTITPQTAPIPTEIPTPLTEVPLGRHQNVNTSVMMSERQLGSTVFEPPKRSVAVKRRRTYVPVAQRTTESQISDAVSGSLFGTIGRMATGSLPVSRGPQGLDQLSPEIRQKIADADQVRATKEAATRETIQGYDVSQHYKQRNFNDNLLRPAVAQQDQQSHLRQSATYRKIGDAYAKSGDDEKARAAYAKADDFGRPDYTSPAKAIAQTRTKKQGVQTTPFGLQLQPQRATGQDQVPGEQRQQKAADPMVAFTQNVQALNGIVGGFDKTITNMGTTLSNLANVFKDLKIPEKITVERSGEVRVVINGGQLLASLTGDVAKLVQGDVIAAIKQQLPAIIKDMPPVT